VPPWSTSSSRKARKRGDRADPCAGEEDERPQDVAGINEVAEEVAALLHGEARKHGVWLRTELAPALPPIEGDRVQLQQVILNLLMNGIEASEGVRGSAARPDHPIAVLRTGPRFSWPCKTRVSGSMKIQASRLFDAFFTTKPVEWAWGLSISRSIVEAHRASVGLAQRGPGATFQFVSRPGPKREHDVGIGLSAELFRIAGETGTAYRRAGVRPRPRARIDFRASERPDPSSYANLACALRCFP